MRFAADDLVRDRRPAGIPRQATEVAKAGALFSTLLGREEEPWASSSGTCRALHLQRHHYLGLRVSRLPVPVNAMRHEHDRDVGCMEPLVQLAA